MAIYLKSDIATPYSTRDTEATLKKLLHSASDFKAVYPRLKRTRQVPVSPKNNVSGGLVSFMTLLRVEIASFHLPRLRVALVSVALPDDTCLLTGRHRGPPYSSGFLTNL